MSTLSVTLLLLLVTVGLLAGCAPSSSSSPAIGAEAFHQESLRALDAVRADLPAISGSASQAATFYCDPKADRGLAIDGNWHFIWELVSRAGGVMSLAGPWWQDFHGVVLFNLRGPAHLADDLSRIAKYNTQGCQVYVIGSADLLRDAQAGGMQAAGTHVVPAGVVADVSVYDLASVAAGWTWICEFVAACTREGHMPTMFQSILVAPSGKERMDKYALNPPEAQRPFVKFHAQTVPPVPAGQLGGQWLTMARKRFDTLRKGELDTIRKAAVLAFEARAAGGSLYFVSNTHVMGAFPGSAHHPPIFAALPAAPKPDAPADPNRKTLSSGDFVLGLGYNNLDNHSNSERLDYIRSSGAKVAWSAATFNPDGIKTQPGELFIAQPWEFGDADVVVPGYDINIAPTSGLMAAAVYFMLCAEINAIEDAAMESAAKKNAKATAAMEAAAIKAEKKAAKQLAKNEAAARKAHDKAMAKAAKNRDRELAKHYRHSRKRDYILPVAIVTLKAAAIATRIVLHCVK
jgi:hypothetical protein